MMKWIGFVLLMLSQTAFSKTAQPSKDPSVDLAHKKKAAGLCSAFYYSGVKQIVLKNGNYDKFKHCGISCLLTLRCPSVDVLELGVLKEVIDLVGPGNADLEDIEADYAGISLVRDKKVSTDQGCISRCHKIYPEKCN